MSLAPVSSHRLNGINLGCGARKREDCLNVDIRSDCGADQVCDLDRVPWPFADNQFQTVYAFDVLEHLHDLRAALAEIHRVARPGALIHVTVPHVSCLNAFTDPTHRHFFTWQTFGYFERNGPQGNFATGHFERRSLRLFFHSTLVNKVVWRLANCFPEIYERRWAWIFPAWFLEVQWNVIK